MSLQSTTQLSIADLSASKRKCKHTFFDQINQLVNWAQIKGELLKYYSKGHSLSGRQAYDPILLFKMMLLQTWYGLSDYQVEEEVNDRLTFGKFCGLSLDNAVPDHSVISRFRTMLTEKKGLDPLLNLINEQLSSQDIMINNGSAAVDASITPTPRKPKGKKTYDIQEDGSLAESDAYQKGVDKEGSWTKKGGNVHYGYKKHVAVDAKEGLVLAVTTTKASASDSTELPNLLEKTDLQPGSRVYTDKGYSGTPNESLLKSKGLKSGIQKKAVKNKPLSATEKRFNKLVSKSRYKVERVFGSIKLWFRSYGARYVGLAKMHTQHLIESIAYNLYRSPNIVLQRAKG